MHTNTRNSAFPRALKTLSGKESTSLFFSQMLKEKNFTFDIAYTSVLKRAIKTLYLTQEEMDLHWIPVIRHWRLNERHYGGLQGLNKSETAAKHGDAQVKVCSM